jgi:hypothetical protein
MLESVCENGDAVVKDLGDEVNNPSDGVTDTGEEGEKTNYESNGVLGLSIADDAVDAADNTAKDNLKQNLGNLGEIFIGLSEIHIVPPKNMCRQIIPQFMREVKIFFGI